MGVTVSADHFIGGRRVPSEERFEDRSPIDESLLAEVARGGEREVELAVRAAEDAFPAWAALGPAGRWPEVTTRPRSRPLDRPVLSVQVACTV